MLMITAACAPPAGPAPQPERPATAQATQLPRCEVRDVADTAGWTRIVSRDAGHAYLLPPGTAYDSVLSYGMHEPMPTYALPNRSFRLAEYRRRGLWGEQLQPGSCVMRIDGIDVAVTEPPTGENQLHLLVDPLPGSLGDDTFAIAVSTVGAIDRPLLMAVIQNLRWSRP